MIDEIVRRITESRDNASQVAAGAEEAGNTEACDRARSRALALDHALSIITDVQVTHSTESLA
jgi:hypothetical protein